MSSRRKEYKVDGRVKMAGHFFLACKVIPAMRVTTPAAMRAKGYFDVEATNRSLVQQVCHEAQKITSENSHCPEQQLRLQC
jgi:hypothetical protein